MTTADGAGCPDDEGLAVLVEGGLDDARARSMLSHLDGCARCQQLVGALASKPLAVRSAGTQIGRFILLAPLGEGGMGVVYAAFDPRLDRKVALKLVRPDRAGAPEARARLLLEAQAMARLAHNNVLTVYEAGEDGDQVYLALELVEGVTLRTWMQAGPRAWSQVLPLWLAAARGLAAAHRAGLVHRDFKPDNVLLGNDGRIRVTDFGLSSLALAARPGARGDALATTSALTRTGALLGTPAYMAPEQWSGGGVDARADQFAFAVSLYEALHGERPFTGRTGAEVQVEVNAGRVAAAPRGRNVPRWLGAAVVRALAADPDQRFPAMDALLDELESQQLQARRRRQRWLAAAMLGLGAATSAGIAASTGSEASCAPGPRLAAVWDADLKEKTRAAFTATALPYATFSFGSAARALDGYASEWSTAYRQACRAPVLSEPQLGCLEERRRDLGAITHQLAAADALTVEGAAVAVGRLEPIERCSRTEVLVTKAHVPTDPQQAARVEALRQELAQTRALLNLGSFAPALARAHAEAVAARALNYRPVIGEALLLLASCMRGSGDDAAAEPVLFEAVEAGGSARDDLLVARAWVELTSVQGSRREVQNGGAGLSSAGHQAAQVARGAIDRIGGDAELEAKLMLARGTLLMDERQFALARADFERAVQLRDLAGSSGPERAAALTNLSLVLRREGKSLDALAAAKRARLLVEEALGPDSPGLMNPLKAQALVETELGRNDEALAALQRALRIGEAAFGPTHRKLVAVLTNLCIAQRELKQLDEAIASCRRSLSIDEKELGSGHPHLAFALNNLGNVLREKGQCGQALEAFVRALALREKDPGPRGQRLSTSLIGLGRTQLACGEPELAVGALERATRLLEAAADEPVWTAEAQFYLGQALWVQNSDRPRASALVQQAKLAFAAEGERGAEGLSEVVTWLAANPQ